MFMSTAHYSNSAKFLPGMLYAVGGLLKVEGRNYLETKKTLDSSFEAAGPTREDEKAEKMLEASKRELSHSDMIFFESEFISHISNFVHYLSQQASPLKKDNLEFYSQWTEPDYVNTPDFDKTKKTEQCN